jgi:hypothetical protein
MSLEKIKISPELRFNINDVINQLHYVCDILSESGNRDAVVEFNNRITPAITKMRRNAGLPSGKTVQVRAKP